MGLRLFFLPNFPGAMFIQGGTFIPDSRVVSSLEYLPHSNFQKKNSFHSNYMRKYGNFLWSSQNMEHKIEALQSPFLVYRSRVLQADNGPFFACPKGGLCKNPCVVSGLQNNRTDYPVSHISNPIHSPIIFIFKSSSSYQRRWLARDWWKATTQRVGTVYHGRQGSVWGQTA